MYQLFCLCLLAASTTALWDKLEIENCGTANDMIKVNKVSLSPIPIPIPGRITITANITIKQDVPKNTKIHLKMYRVTKVIWEIDIKIPCIGGVGSCSYDHCEILEKTRDLTCKFYPKGRTCGCPVLKGNYNATNVQYDLPYLGGIVAWLATGNYKAEIVIKDEAAGRQLACYKARVSLGKQ